LYKKTKVIATLGPATENPVLIRKKINSGVNVFLANFSHGTKEEHQKRIRMIRTAKNELITSQQAAGEFYRLKKVKKQSSSRDKKS